MEFVYGCLTIFVIVLSLFFCGMEARNKNIAIIHWILGFFAGMLFIVFLFLGLEYIKWVL